MKRMIRSTEGQWAVSLVVRNKVKGYLASIDDEGVATFVENVEGAQIFDSSSSAGYAIHQILNTCDSLVYKNEEYGVADVDGTIYGVDIQIVNLD